MKLRKSFQSLIRSPLKTVIAFALLAATSFAFVSRGVEYFAADRAVADAARAYPAVGTLVATAEKYEEHFGIAPKQNPDEVKLYSPIDEEAIDLLLESGYVASSELRHVAGGISNVHRSVAEQPVGTHDDNTKRLGLDETIVIAECIAVITNPFAEPDGRWELDIDWEAYMLFTVDEVLAGDASQYAPGTALNHVVAQTNRSGDTVVYRADKPIFRIALDPHSSLYDTFVAGHRYVLSLTPAKEYGEAIKELTGGVPNNLLDLTLIEQEKGSVGYEDYAHILENRYGRLTELNHRKQELVYTSDMSLLPRFHDGSLSMAEGRMITPEDTGDVCVINADYATRNGIRVGDTVSFTVDPNTMVYAGEVFARELYSPEFYATGSRYSNHAQTQMQKSYEVVGIWASPIQGESYANIIEPDYYDPDALNFALNTVFVPSATYPWQDEISPHSFPSTFSFLLTHPNGAHDLELELGDQLRELGYELVINDLGYSEVASSLSSLRFSAVIGAVAMGEALLFTLILITYMFVARRKDEYALTNGDILLELFILAIPAVAVGSAVALLTLGGYATSLASSVANITGAAASVAYSPLLVAVLCAGVLLLLLIFAAIGLGARVAGRKASSRR